MIVQTHHSCQSTGGNAKHGIVIAYNDSLVVGNVVYPHIKHPQVEPRKLIYSIQRWFTIGFTPRAAVVGFLFAINLQNQAFYHLYHPPTILINHYDVPLFTIMTLDMLMSLAMTTNNGSLLGTTTIATHH